MIRPVFPFGPFRPFIAIYTLNGRRRRYHRLNKQPAGNDGDDELVNSHHDDDDDDRDGDLVHSGNDNALFMILIWVMVMLGDLVFSDRAVLYFCGVLCLVFEDLSNTTNGQCQKQSVAINSEM